jgi:hypothetical protein
MLLGVFVLFTMRINPRLWLQDFPADIQALVPPKTRAEQRQTIIWGIPLVALFVGIPLASTWLLKDQHGGELPFLVACGHAYGVFVVANLFDLLIIDWLGFALTDPQRPPFPGTEGAAGYRDYAFHARGFLKGMLIGVVFALPVGAVVTWVL